MVDPTGAFYCGRRKHNKATGAQVRSVIRAMQSLPSSTVSQASLPGFRFFVTVQFLLVWEAIWVRNTNWSCTAAKTELSSPSLEWQQSGGEAERRVGGGGGRGWGIHTNQPVRWSCLKPPRLDKPHQKRISPLFSHPLTASPSAPLPFPPLNPSPPSLRPPTVV